jgi:hypothetical protein
VKLDDFRKLVKSLIQGNPDETAGSAPDPGPARRIIAEFEASMCNDLHAGDAFDNLLGVLKELHSSDRENHYTGATRKEIRQSLEKIDSVLGVIF